MTEEKALNLPAGYTLRPTVLDDFDEFAAIFREYDPEPPSAEELKRRFSSRDPRGFGRDWTVEKDGRAIAYARLVRREHNAEGCFNCNVDVHKDHRRQGIGTLLIGLIMQESETQQAKMVTSWVREEYPEWIRFAAKHDLKVERVLSESSMKLPPKSAPAFADAAAKVEGITWKSWSDLGDTEENRRKLHAAQILSDTAPDMDVWGKPSFEQFEKDFFENLKYFEQGVLVAMDGDEIVGMHYLMRDPENDQWITDYTGVIPSYRRRGIAYALKLWGIEVAQEHGAKEIMTYNDSENTGMLAINGVLGFVRKPGYAQVRRRWDR